MTYVFVSRPTWVAPNFEKGLASFLRLLENMKLKPRTLGAGGDYPSKSPLDEVIALMNECQGAIILGYPQIVVTAGKCKDKDLTDTLLLPTEWNHIEAGLAYAKGLPLLTVHHRGVKRGVFDRGAVNSFVYEIDLTDAAWPLDERISGALTKWTKDVVKNPHRVALVDPEKGRKPLTKELVSVLQVIASNPMSQPEDVAQILKISDEKAAYFVGELSKAGLVTIDGSLGIMALLQLSHEGRAALVERGLL